MITKELEISVRHYNLLKIFFEANQLFEIGFTLEIKDIQYDLPTNNISNHKKFTQTKTILVYSYDDNCEIQTSKIVDLSLKHLGFNNMLHDYLNKCGVSTHCHNQ